MKYFVYFLQSAPNSFLFAGFRVGRRRHHQRHPLGGIAGKVDADEPLEINAGAHSRRGCIITDRRRQDRACSIVARNVNADLFQEVRETVIGLSQRKAVMIISPQWKEISRQIMEKLQRGVTMVQGEGGYSGQQLHILYSVITLIELSRFKEMVRKIDPNAFVVVTETLEVMGKGIGNQPHW